MYIGLGLVNPTAAPPTKAPVKNGNIIYYTGIDGSISFVKCHTTDDYENIFKHILLSKKQIKSYGRVIYSFVPEFTKK